MDATRTDRDHRDHHPTRSKLERSSTPTRVLDAGATGYVGRRLVGELVATGSTVRCFVRTPAKLDDESWRDQVQVVTGDVLDVESLLGAMHGVQVAYYLVHSIGSDPNWQERDRRAAENFRDAAAAAGVEQIIYLGGLGDSSTALSPHLRSRHEVGETLRSGPVPVTELRAAVVIGSGSASFEMLRHLVEVLPIMTTPQWVETRVQPIAIRDILAYLIGVLGARLSYGLILEVGGADVVTYRRMMEIYAEEAGLRRRTRVLVHAAPLPPLRLRTDGRAHRRTCRDIRTRAGGSPPLLKKDRSMPKYQTVVLTPWSPDRAFAYLSDLGHFADWDPGVKRSVQVDGEGPGIGASYDVTVSSPGRDLTLRYKAVIFEPPRRIEVPARDSSS